MVRVATAHADWLGFSACTASRVLTTSAAEPVGGAVRCWLRKRQRAMSTSMVDSMDMDQRISFVTLAVADLDATRRFYLDGLGWQADMDVPGEVLMIRVGEHVVLSLWNEDEFEAEVGPIGRGDGVAPFTLAHNVATPEEVDAVLATARAAGADPDRKSTRLNSS